MKRFNIFLMVLMIIIITIGTIGAIVAGNVLMSLIGIAILIWDFNTLFSIMDN